ncbi:MAG: two-component sensor histidine kinase [Actinobacteria bacterium]|nr:two-component sensor histidine kinase [Actinomycetota bacterium]
MTARLLAMAVTLAGALAAAAGTGLPLVAAVSTGALIGLVTGGGLWLAERARVRDLAREVNEWLGGQGRDPVRVPDTAGWDQLAVSLNALGAAYSRRGARLSRARGSREQLVDALPEAALLFDEDGYLVRANPVARERFTIAPSAARTAAQTLGSPRLSDAVSEARDAERAVRLELSIQDRELVAVAAPVGDEVLLVVSDQTARRRVDAVRRDFVANASHELKTPVSGIQALAEALEVTIDRDPDRSQALVRRLSGEAERLGKLVHHLLDLRRLEEDRPAAERRSVDLAELLRAEIDRVAPGAEQRGLEVRVDVPDRAVVVGIEDDLRLIAANLLDNAVGYNQPGGQLRITLERIDAAWQLQVADTGIGIAQHDLDRIFERFYRVDVARSRATGGTGLGLSLVRHAVERHGGSVSVDSILGEGSTFTVTLPIEPH